MALTDIAIRNAKAGGKAIKMADGGGMFLLVTPAGGKLWRLKYRVDGREKLLSIGAYPEISLSEARKRRDQARELLAQGQDPSREKRRAKVRAKAEAENTRRRADEEVSKARKYAVESFAESLLPVKDSLEAAIAAGDADPQQLLEGVHATLRQLASALERNKVVELNPSAGTRFDPHQHQAISMVSADQEPNTVVAVLQKGYLIADRVLRPALVTVSAPR